MQKLFKQLEEQDWLDDHRIDDPRISIQDSYTYGTSENVADDFVNYQYPLTFNQFKNYRAYKHGACDMVLMF